MYDTIADLGGGGQVVGHLPTPLPFAKILNPEVLANLKGLRHCSLSYFYHRQNYL